MSIWKRWPALGRGELEQSARGRALLLTPEAPYPLDGGGALRSASLLEYLGSRYRVDVVVFRQPGAANPTFRTTLSGDVLVLDLPQHSSTPWPGC